MKLAWWLVVAVASRLKAMPRNGRFDSSEVLRRGCLAVWLVGGAAACGGSSADRRRSAIFEAVIVFH